jgi:ApeA N-terminal domain 1
VTNRDGFRIHRLNASFQHLGAWLREEGFKAPSEQEDQFSIQYRRPPDRSFEISKGVTIYLYHSARSSFRNRQRKIAYDIFFRDIEEALIFLDASFPLNRRSTKSLALRMLEARQIDCCNI